MEPIQFDFKDQVKELAARIANLEVENTQLKVINQKAFERINELEAKLPKQNKPKVSAK